MHFQITPLRAAGAAVLTGALLAGCGGGPGGYMYETPRGVSGTPMATMPARAAYDVDIGRRVKAALDADPVVASQSALTVSVVDGVAELKGSVETRGVLERAMAIARRVPGVVSVAGGATSN